MENCFAGTREGRIAQQEYEKKVEQLIQEELNRHVILKFDSEELNIAYQEEVRRLIEEKVRDMLQ